MLVDVYMLTTIAHHQLYSLTFADWTLGTVEQPATGNLKQPREKPKIVHDYNKFMGAVDRCDQMVAYSCFRRRTMKWWKKVFFHLFSLTILNAYILYKERTKSPDLHRTFFRELVKELITSTGISPSLTPRGRPRRSAEGFTRLQPGYHYPEKIQATG